MTESCYSSCLECEGSVVQIPASARANLICALFTFLVGHFRLGVPVHVLRDEGKCDCRHSVVAVVRNACMTASSPIPVAST